MKSSFLTKRLEGGKREGVASSAWSSDSTVQHCAISIAATAHAAVVNKSATGRYVLFIVESRKVSNLHCWRQYSALETHKSRNLIAAPLAALSYLQQISTPKHAAIIWKLLHTTQYHNGAASRRLPTPQKPPLFHTTCTRWPLLASQTLAKTSNPPLRKSSSSKTCHNPATQQKN